MEGITKKREGMVQILLLEQFCAHDGCSASPRGNGEDVGTVGIGASARDMCVCLRVRECVCSSMRV